MDIKVNNLSPVNQTENVKNTPEADGSFKFVLASNVEESELKARLTTKM